MLVFSGVSHSTWVLTIGSPSNLFFDYVIDDNTCVYKYAFGEGSGFKFSMTHTYRIWGGGLGTRVYRSILYTFEKFMLS